MLLWLVSVSFVVLSSTYFKMIRCFRFPDVIIFFTDPDLPDLPTSVREPDEVRRV